MGSIQLEVSMVGIWDLIISVTKPFYVHAREKNIGFKVQCSAVQTATSSGSGRSQQAATLNASDSESVGSESHSRSVQGRYVYNLEDASKKIVLIPENGGSITQHGLETLQSLVIVGDQVKIGQVIRNLVSNAFKFTSEGDVTISGMVSLDVFVCILVYGSMY